MKKNSLLIIMLLVFSSCGTLYNLEYDGKTVDGEPVMQSKIKPPRPAAVYGGVGWDVYEMKKALSGDDSLPCMAPIPLLDMPLSFILDTLMLPYTMW